MKERKGEWCEVQQCYAAVGHEMAGCGETFQDKTLSVVRDVVFGYSLRCFHDDLRLGEMGRAEIRIPAQQVDGQFIDDVRTGPNEFDGNVPNITVDG